MSLFGSLMGDFEDEPIFGSHMRSMMQMNSMMNSLFNSPFGMMGQNAITDGHHRPAVAHNELQMMPFGFPAMPAFNMQRIYADFDNMAAGGNCHSFTSRSFVTMTNGPDGRPQVYKETMSTKTAPGGIKETKKTVCDSHSGTKKMSIGHHIGERAHILEREQNYHSGEQEEHQEFINLEEDEAESFNHEWETRTRRSVAAIGPNYGGTGGHSRSRPEHRQLALPDPSASRHSSSSSRWAPSARRSIRPVSTSKLRNTTSGISSNTSGLPKATTSATPAIVAAAAATTATATATATSPSTSSTSSTKGTRKRQHTSDVKESKKRPAV